MELADLAPARERGQWQRAEGNKTQVPPVKPNNYALSLQSVQLVAKELYSQIGVIHSTKELSSTDQNKRLDCTIAFMFPILDIWSIVIKPRPDIDPVDELSHWVTGSTSSTSGSLVEPQDSNITQYEAAAALLAEFQGKPKAKPERKNFHPQCWTPPEQGVYKANYDGAYFVEEEKAGIGVVVRNELGQVMGSLAEKIEMSAFVEVLEALAAKRAMIFMEELGLRQAIFEGDSEIVVKALVGDCPVRSSIGHIVKNCKSLMGLFQTYTFSHVRRQINSVAHALARRAKNSSPLFVWMESVPSDISYIVYVDITP
ncbi:hypothetical protein SO802_034561 [Lithocarpus litseifolius]|uniref:RNase H type-1 domain-containing protein n=1 Tax=Lithocarpus litseifolius TaxID=425828 RepID=A0AAW2BGB2_9ROSI